MEGQKSKLETERWLKHMSETRVQMGILIKNAYEKGYTVYALESSSEELKG